MYFKYKALVFCHFYYVKRMWSFKAYVSY
uniref:Uncharacterized protein n=1 Tax=Anguilla anguilla TaxID=7936 RepID=A0A0E9UNR7_ANGAN